MSYSVSYCQHEQPTTGREKEKFFCRQYFLRSAPAPNNLRLGEFYSSVPPPPLLSSCLIGRKAHKVLPHTQTLFEESVMFDKIIETMKKVKGKKKTLSYLCQIFLASPYNPLSLVRVYRTSYTSVLLKQLFFVIVSFIRKEQQEQKFDYRSICKSIPFSWHLPCR